MSVKDVVIYGPTGDAVSILDTAKANVSLDELLAAAATVDMGSHKLINLLDGTNPTDAVTKEQLDAIAARDSAGAEDYIVYYDGANWNARNNATGVVDVTGSDFATVFNRASLRLSSYGLEWVHTRNGKTCYYGFPTAPSGVIVPGGGVMEAGDHFWTITAVRKVGSVEYESMPSKQIMFTNALHDAVTITLPSAGAPSGTTHFRIYRTVHPGGSYTHASAGPALTDYRDAEPSEMQFIAEVTVGTTSYSDATTTDAALDSANTQLADSYSTMSDGGAVRIARAAGYVASDGTIGVIDLTQGLQCYSGVSIIGNAQATKLRATSAYRQQIGTLHLTSPTGSGDYRPGVSVDTTFQVTESVTPPATPFSMLVAGAGGADEVVLVTARTLVSGSIFSYTVVRGYASWPSPGNLTGTDTKACYITEYGQARVGAMIDAYNCDRCRVESMNMDANAGVGAWNGILQKRTKASEAGGAHGTSRVMFNHVYGIQGGTALSNGKPNDVSATSNLYTFFNVCECTGANGVGLATFIGDSEHVYNNIVNGGVWLAGGATQLKLNHIPGNSRNCVTIWKGSYQSIENNYLDNVNGQSHAVYRSNYMPDGVTVSAAVTTCNIQGGRMNAQSIDGTAAAASYQTTLGGNSDIVVTALVAGVAGNNITFKYTAAGSLSYSETGTAITVNVQNGVTTASAVLAAINASSTLVVATLAAGSSGAGTVTGGTVHSLKNGGDTGCLVRFDQNSARIQIRNVAVQGCGSGAAIAYVNGTNWFIDGMITSGNALVSAPASPNVPMVGNNQLGSTPTQPTWVGSGTHAARPSAGNVMPGARYFETDTLAEYQSDGVSTWTLIGTAMRALVMGLAGTVPGSATDTADFLVVAPANMLLQRMKATCKTAPGGAMAVQLRRSTDGGATYANVSGFVTSSWTSHLAIVDPADVAINEGDILNFSISTGSGSNLMVEVVGSVA